MSTEQFCVEVLLFVTLQSSLNDKYIFLKNLFAWFTIEERISLLMDKAPEDEKIEKKIFSIDEKTSSVELMKMLLDLGKREKRIFIRELLKDFTPEQVASILVR